MDENEQSAVDTQTDDVLSQEDTIMEEADQLPEEPKKKEYTPEQKLARVERLRAKYMKELGVEAKTESKSERKSVAGELDNADYAFLAVKGYEHDEDIDLIKDKMKKWNLPLRDLLKDEDIVNKLKAQRIAREATAATPGSTRRSSGNAADTEDYFYQKYEQTGKLPDNMPHGMAEKLVNRRYAEANPRLNPFE